MKVNNNTDEDQTDVNFLIPSLIVHSSSAGNLLPEGNDDKVCNDNKPEVKSKIE